MVLKSKKIYKMSVNENSELTPKSVTDLAKYAKETGQDLSQIVKKIGEGQRRIREMVQRSA